MVREMVSRSLKSEPAHICGPHCLGPLTFHKDVMGALVSLSQGARQADRTGVTFRHGLVFSSRPVRPQERVRLRVELCKLTWLGAMRVGFTNVLPIARALPSLAIPDLTDLPGHWAAPVPETCCLPGSELEFWVSHGGRMYFRNANRQGHRYSIYCESVEDYAVCMSQKACISLQCGHQCLCLQCAISVIQEFGNCPLCRQNIKSFLQTKLPSRTDPNYSIGRLFGH
ncbi:E3 ubiquitin-protein ligase NEURL3-like [Oncorhynchus kisutch]|uniref:E3 ubiquitin-protein ligase NEURL3-like n=1 Tax=Oncorhynchus kisutch TaxID=8019 RepID=UPI0012DE7278|nr:E3 ubiquitin-protein ligase NEURL3-like [Oncorhynchus kisutch]